MIVHSTFVKPDFDKPLDLAATIAEVPESATVRGMFFQMLNDRARREQGQPLRENVPPAFSRGSMRDYMELLVAAATTLYPNVPVREGLRRVGHTLYDDFFSTMVGKAIFSVAGRNFLRLTDLAPRAYEVSYEPCALRTEILGPNNVRVAMRPVHVFPDSFQVGAWEGAARFCSIEPMIRITPYATSGFLELDITYA
jgi:uncharacterized protein (TIGR02265 family)